MSSRQHPTKENLVRDFREQAEWCRKTAAKTYSMEERAVLLKEAEHYDQLAKETLAE